MRIALDAMGGDQAPAAVVEGAVQALKGNLTGAEVILVGRPREIEDELARLGGAPRGLTIHAATQVVGMEDSPSQALRRMRDSSIRVCFDLLAQDRADAVVSAGNSGATMAVAMVVAGRLPEVDRPALASVFPGLHGPTVIIDVGANVDCSPLMLLQFAYMGAAYAQRVLGAADPTVGLLSIGEEDSKGNLVVKQTHDMLKASQLNFMGNVEGRDLFTGEVSVVVCDGFVGNVCLKLVEGLAGTLKRFFLEGIAQDLPGKVGALLLKKTLTELGNRMDWETYGGAPLLGINGAAFICHGASSPRAIASAMGMAADAIKGRLVEHLSEGLGQYRGRLLGGDEADQPG